MYYAIADLPQQDRYRLLTNTVVPRPIAWLSTRDAQGRRNLAPFSFFNALCSVPPIVGVGIARDPVREGMAEKDSLAAIRETGEFVVAMVDEAHAEQMNLTAAAAPAGADEFEFAGVEPGAARLVGASLVATAPVNFECRVWQLLEPTPHTAIILGEVLAVHVADRFVGEEDGKLRIDTPAMHLIGRGHGAGWYWRDGDPLHIGRKGWPLEGG